MDDEIKIKEILKALNKYKKSILLIVLVITSAATIYGTFEPLKYQSKVTLIPNESKLDMGSIMGGGAGGVVSSLLGAPGSSEVTYYKAIINSTRFFRQVVKRLGYTKFYEHNIWDAEKKKWNLKKGQKEPTFEKTVGAFKEGVTLTFAPTKNLVTITYETATPELAYDVVKAISLELHNMVNKKGYIEARWKRIFVENQIKDVQKTYLELGKDLTSYYDKRQGSAALAEVDVDLSKSVWDSVFKDTVIGEFSEKDAKEMLDVDNSVVKSVPEHVYIEYLTAKKRLLVKILGVLVNNHELAKFEEAQQRLAFHIIDEPILNRSPSRNYVQQFFIFSLVGSIVFALITVFVRERLSNFKLN